LQSEQIGLSEEDIGNYCNSQRVMLLCRKDEADILILFQTLIIEAIRIDQATSKLKTNIR